MSGALVTTTLSPYSTSELNVPYEPSPLPLRRRCLRQSQTAFAVGLRGEEGAKAEEEAGAGAGAGVALSRTSFGLQSIKFEF